MRKIEGDIEIADIDVFSSNTGKYGPEKTPYLDTFHAVLGFVSFFGFIATNICRSKHILKNCHQSVYVDVVFNVCPDQWRRLSQRRLITLRQI